MGIEIQRSTNDNLREPHEKFRGQIYNKESERYNLEQARNDLKFITTDRNSKDVNRIREPQSELQRSGQ